MASSQPSPLIVNLSDCTNVQIGTNNDQIHVINNTQTARGLQDQLNSFKRHIRQQEINNKIRRDELKQQFKEFRNETACCIAKLQAQLSIIRKKCHRLEAKSTEEEYKHNEMKSVLEEMKQKYHMKTTQLTEMGIQRRKINLLDSFIMKPRRMPQYLKTTQLTEMSIQRRKINLPDSFIMKPRRMPQYLKTTQLTGMDIQRRQIHLLDSLSGNLDECHNI